MPENHEEVYFARDAAGNSAVGFDITEVEEAIGEFGDGPIRIIQLNVEMALPVEGDDEDTVASIDVEVPPQEEPAEDDDEGEDEHEKEAVAA
jgi:hypothetical protein